MSNDWHLELSNIDIIDRIVDDMIIEAKTLGVDQLIIAGDVFDVRASQKLDVMTAFLNILEKFKENELTAHVVAGNHDKSVYSESDSWLTPFKNHPSIRLYEDIAFTSINGLNICFMPFFIESMMVERLKDLPKVDLFVGHLEMNGSVGDAGKVMKNKPISPPMFKNAKLTLLGHYHNPCWVNKGIRHMPSLYQRNYGEDTTKGFTVLYDNLTIDHIQSKFKHYESFDVDITEGCDEILDELIKLSNEGETNVRVRLLGEEAKVKSFNRTKLKEAGIAIQSEFDEIEIDETEGKAEIKALNTEEINQLFIEFCESRSLELETGKKYLE